ncbi:MAG: methylenetetrahydromethanopterin dehydrogenase [Gammaproteobacteria bacterium]|nr:methylenetetrahydromethanopterin dehydrogenase [Gammaproteobacteria bacterium]MDH3887474.1 methylenetetrahydromethanopterin dehydrogenase [Gammaproteobacteria bacterium]MDH3933566.1 methylenetetrahydromethanopterin dehydrogenase [Gammaproteobacteria bacterium]MDH3971514.1 methylenetetrahydromethanopterin dehydrogenase [Gammaproteobacteria bacterium]MDH3985793.1 methylenetetrahydromethanopterin dehydrogenase [Gammaproteobacteria bacterium]
MSKPFILHMITPAKNLSPFDVNMAVDAGWTTVIPYTQVETAEVPGLVQDAIFSRGPKGVRRTGLFIGGRDIDQAMDMLQLAQGAMVPPFEVSVFADPSGAFTTAAGLVAAVERQLQTVYSTGLNNQRVLVFGGTGPVGIAASVIAVRAGAKVSIVGHSSDARPRQMTAACKQRYDIDLDPVDGSSDALKEQLLEDADVVFGTAAAGVQVLSSDNLKAATKLKVAGDLNAVPPLGIEGVDLMDDGKVIANTNGAVGIGALAIGDIKYQVQHALLQDMMTAENPCYLDFQDAFERARNHVAQH